MRFRWHDLLWPSICKFSARVFRRAGGGIGDGRIGFGVSWIGTHENVLE